MSDKALKPCPFCGSTDSVKWEWRETYSLDSSYAVFGCIDCDITFPAHNDNGVSQPDCDRWNNRQPTPIHPPFTALKEENERLWDALSHIEAMHGNNPSDAYADMPREAYLEMKLFNVRKYARAALAGQEKK